MAGGRIRNLIHYLRRAAPRAEGPAMTDTHLLERFAAEGDEAAFEQLARRHGPMVLGVCRRVLGDAHDAEDALQATFLLLARKPASAARCRSAGGWLHTVAYRVSLRARRAARGTRELPPDESPAPALDPASEAAWREVRRAIDEEVSRLPEKYRAPFVLYHLEGRSIAEVARELGCPVGTVESWLTRARARLRDGLARRGLAPALGMVAALTMQEGWLPQATAAARAALAAARGEAGAVSAEAAALAGEVVRALGVARLRVAVLLLLLAVAVAGAIGLVVGTPPRVEPPPRPAEAPRQDKARPDEKPRAAQAGPVKLRTFNQAHVLAVNAIALSPDGKILVSGGDDGRVKLWDVNTGRTKALLCRFLDLGKHADQRQAHAGRVWSVAFSPDGKTLASGADDRVVRLWEVGTGGERAMGLCGFFVYAVTFSPDGRHLASAGGNAPAAFDRDQRMIFKNFPKGGGQFKEHGEVKVWDLGTAKGRTLLHRTAGRVLSVAFSPDSKTLASGGRDGFVRLWDVKTGTERKRFRQPNHCVTAVAFSPDGKTLAEVTGWDDSDRAPPPREEDDRVSLRDLASGRVRARLKGHVGWVTALAFSPDGKILATASAALPPRARPWAKATGEVQLWDPAAGQPLGAPLTFGHRVASVAFDPRGEILAVGGPGASALGLSAPGEMTLVKLGPRGGTAP
jgi:RNA polymerase sigma factor (sigma-70 family)